jgi:hypothetical protein
MCFGWISAGERLRLRWVSGVWWMCCANTRIASMSATSDAVQGCINLTLCSADIPIQDFILAFLIGRVRPPGRTPCFLCPILPRIPERSTGQRNHGRPGPCRPTHVQGQTENLCSCLQVHRTSSFGVIPRDPARAPGSRPHQQVGKPALRRAWCSPDAVGIKKMTLAWRRPVA